MVPVCFCERFFKICGTFAPLPQHHILHKPLQRSWLCKIEGSQFGARNFAKASRVLYVWFIRKIYDSISYVVHVNIYHDIVVDFFTKSFNYHHSTKEPRKMGAPPRAFRATAGKPGVVKGYGKNQQRWRFWIIYIWPNYDISPTLDFLAIRGIPFQNAPFLGEVMWGRYNLIKYVQISNRRRLDIFLWHTF